MKHAVKKQEEHLNTVTVINKEEQSPQKLEPATAGPEVIQAITLLLKSGLAKSAFTPEGQVTAEGSISLPWHRNNFFAMATKAEVENPFIITTKRQESKEVWQEQHNRVLEAAHEAGAELLAVRAGSSGGRFTLGFGKRKNPEIPFQPRNIQLPVEEQEPSSSGLIFNPDSSAGNHNKRLSPVFGFAESVLAVPEASDPSKQILLNSQGEFLKVLVLDAKPHRDGQGAITQSAAYKLLKAMTPPGGTNPSQWINRAVNQAVALQIKGLGLTALKGVPIILENQNWPEEWADYDLVLDAECIKHDVQCTESTYYTVNTANALPFNRGYRLVGSLMQTLSLLDLFDADEVTRSQKRTVQRLVQEDRKKLLQKLSQRDTRGPQELLEEILGEARNNEVRNGHAYQNWEVSPETKRKNESLAELGLRAENSPAANNIAVRMTAGRTAGRTRSQLQSASPRKAGMPAVLLSGESVVAMSYDTAQVSKPRKGYAAPVFRQLGQVYAGICISPEDYAEAKPKLSGFDFDLDYLDTSFGTYEGKEYVFIERHPMSPGGGFVARVNKENSRKLRKLGYEFLPMKSLKIENAHCYEIDEAGEPKVPYAITAGKLYQKPQWGSTEESMLEGLWQLTRFNRNIGLVTNTVFAIAASGLFDEKKHWGEISEIIDACHKGTADTNVAARAYTRELAQLHQQGASWEGRFYHAKIKNMLKRYWEENFPGEELPKPKLHRRPDFEALSANGLEVVNQSSRYVAVQELSANGPLDGLLLTGGESPAAEAARETYAFRLEINKAENRRMRELQALKKEYPEMESSEPARQIRLEARALLEEAAMKGYETARSNDPNYQKGAFFKELRLLELRREGTESWKGPRADSGVKRSSIAYMGCLPPEEITSGHQGNTPMTLITRLSEKQLPGKGLQNLIPGNAGIIGWLKQETPDEKAGLGLFSADGSQFLAHLARESESYMWLYPGETKPEENGKTIPVTEPKWKLPVIYWGLLGGTGNKELAQQEGDILVFEIIEIPEMPEIPWISQEDRWVKMAERGEIQNGEELEKE